MHALCKTLRICELSWKGVEFCDDQYRNKDSRTAALPDAFKTVVRAQCHLGAILVLTCAAGTGLDNFGKIVEFDKIQFI